MADERISYEMLQDMLRSERRSNKLSPVHSRFWHHVRDFLDEVMAAFRQEQEKDPFSRRVMMVTDEVKHARQAVDAIWALRERKMALFALSQVREATPKRPDGMTPDEERVYDHVLQALALGRRAVIEGTPLPERIEAPEAEKETREVAAPAPAEPAPAAPVEAPPAAVPADTPDEDMVMIKALSDIPAFVGPDMQTYLLKEGDVATVPKPIADLLGRRKKAALIGA